MRICNVGAWKVEIWILPLKPGAGCRSSARAVERGKRGGFSLAGWGIDEWDHRSRLAAEMSECGRERLNGK